MITKDHLIFDLLGIARNGRVVDDESFTPENVGFWVDTTRAKLIRQDINKGRSINPDIIQIISCLDMILVDASECGCDVTGCKVLRSKDRLPTAIEINNKNLITRIGPVGVTSKGFTIMPYERAQLTGHNKFTAHITKAFIRDRYVYLITNDYLPKISVSGVWSFPEELSKYTTCSGDPCYSKTSYYPISAHMVEDLKQMILRADLAFGLSTLDDRVNDADSLPPTQTPAKTSGSSSNSRS